MGSTVEVNSGSDLSVVIIGIKRSSKYKTAKKKQNTTILRHKMYHQRSLPARISNFRALTYTTSSSSTGGEGDEKENIHTDLRPALRAPIFVLKEAVDAPVKSWEVSGKTRSTRRHSRRRNCCTRWSRIQGGGHTWLPIDSFRNDLLDARSALGKRRPIAFRAVLSLGNES